MGADLTYNAQEERVLDEVVGAVIRLHEEAGVRSVRDDVRIAIEMAGGFEQTTELKQLVEELEEVVTEHYLGNAHDFLASLRERHLGERV